MERPITVTVPIIKKAVFTLDIDNIEELFKILEYPFNTGCNESSEIAGIDPDIDVFMKEDKIQAFKEEIVHFLLVNMIYSDYATCQDLSRISDLLDSMIDAELLIDGVDEVDTFDPDFTMPSHASPMLHFVYHFFNGTSFEEHIRITQILKDINLIDEMGLELDWEDMKVRLTSEQIHILSTFDI